MPAKNKGMGGHQSARSRTNEWFTPREIIDTLGPFDLDPCTSKNRPWDTAAQHYTIEDDGLSKDWRGRVWMNPPYSAALIIRWMKQISEHDNGIALIFARTDTKPFHEYVFPFADSLFFVKRRIVFCTSTGHKARYDGGAPSVFIAYGEMNSDSLADSGFKGYHERRNGPTYVIIGVSPKWISVVTIAVDRVGEKHLQPIYEMVERIAPDKVRNNQYWKEKVRQQMQLIRKKKNIHIDL